MKLYRLLFILILASPALAGCKKNTGNASNQKNTSFRTVGYLMIDRGDIATVVSQIDFTSLSHLNLAFINPDSTGAFANNSAIPQIVTLAHGNNVKVLMSLAGGDIPPYFTSLLADSKRAAFTNSIAAMVAKYSFDGVDVDIEGDNINFNYGKFVIGLAAALSPNNKLLTAAVASWDGSSVPDSALAAFNFINLMAYDSTGPWAPTHPGQHSSYAFAANDINYWGNTRSVPKNKMNLGVPFYGYSFGPNNAVESMNFGDIVAAYPAAANEDQFTLSNGAIVYYNGIPTIKNKTKLALQQAGGMMIWELSQDDTGNNSLLKNIHAVIAGN
jgi:GH18 family chitinase